MTAQAARMSRPLLEVEGLKKHFPIHKGVFSRVSGQVYAVDGVSFQIGRGETLGLVGESGCGKSTVGPHAAEAARADRRHHHASAARTSPVSTAQAMLPYRRRMQMIYQDPYASLNPRMTAGEIVGEPLIIHDVGDAGRAPRARRRPVRARRAAARGDELLSRTSSPAASASASASPARWRSTPS